MKKSRRVIIFAIIIVVVIGVSAAAAVFISQYNASKDTANTDNNPAIPPKSPAEQKADDADKLAFEGDLSGGIADLDKAIQSTTDSHDKFIYYSQKATLLFNNNDLAGAFEAAKKAYDLEKTSDSAAFVGQIAQQKGDTAVALEYYKKAITLIDPTDPFVDEDKRYYEGIVTDLEGK